MHVSFGKEVENLKCIKQTFSFGKEKVQLTKKGKMWKSK